VASHPLIWLDVFTSRPLTGNALAVVLHADGLDDPAMLAVARETRLSETTFVQRTAVEDADYRNRIWMMTGEIDFAGHPSIGTAVAVAHARAERSARYVQETRAGLQAIEVELASASVARASMEQEPAEFGVEIDPALAVAAVGLDPADLHPELPPQIVGTGVPQLLVPVRAEAVLAHPRPRFQELRDLLAEHRCVVAYVVHPEGERVHARSFFPAPTGVEEDPATGAAAGPLCAYLHERTGVTRLEIEQGVAMGRPSRLLCEYGERVKVAGDAVVIAEGTLRI